MLTELFKRYRTIFILLLVGFLVATVVAFMQSFKNPYGDQLEITGFADYVKDKPRSIVSEKAIRASLLRTVQLNSNRKVQNNSVTDIAIRDQTFSQTYSASKAVYSVRFIIDIPSLKQSYLVRYQWTPSGSVKNLDEYGTNVSCLPVHLLKYGDFKCKDSILLQRGDGYDLVGLLLPHLVDSKYNVYDYTKSADKYVTLKVLAFIPRSDLAPSDELLDSYSKEIKQWLASKKLDPNKYVFEFSY